MPARSFVVKAGSASVPVYASTRTVKGRRYPLYVVCHYLPDGKRVRQAFGKRTRAYQEADRIAKAMSRGQQQAVQFKAADAELYAKAVRILQPSGASVVEAALDFARRHPSSAPRKTVQQVADELIHDTEIRKLSAAYGRDLRHRLDLLATALPGPLADVSPGQVRDWLRGLKGVDGRDLSARSKLNSQHAVRRLWHFARRRRYVSREAAEEMAELELPKVVMGEPGIFTPPEMRRILDAAEPQRIPALVLGAFAGLRAAEIHRLSWDAVKLSERVLVVGADRAKTASRRVVPLADNLVEWLTPHARTSGPVAPQGVRHAALAREAGVVWKHNALRHSYISYRTSVIHDVARVAAESGNSPAMIHRHYRALVNEAAGREWFSIRPAKSGNLVAFHAEAVA